jgi:hypothetical protein
MSRAFVEKWEVKMEQKMATSKHPKMIESVPISTPTPKDAIMQIWFSYCNFRILVFFIPLASAKGIK